MQQFQVGDRIRNKETGRVVTVTAYQAGCGNVYIGQGREEISPRQYELVPPDAPTQEPVPVPVEATPGQEPQPVAVNGHSTNGNGRVPTGPLRRVTDKIREVIPS